MNCACYSEVFQWTTQKKLHQGSEYCPSVENLAKSLGFEPVLKNEVKWNVGL